MRPKLVRQKQETNRCNYFLENELKIQENYVRTQKLTRREKWAFSVNQRRKHSRKTQAPPRARRSGKNQITARIYPSVIARWTSRYSGPCQRAATESRRHLAHPPKWPSAAASFQLPAVGVVALSNIFAPRLRPFPSLVQNQYIRARATAIFQDVIFSGPARLSRDLSERNILGRPDNVSMHTESKRQ